MAIFVPEFATAEPVAPPQSAVVVSANADVPADDGAVARGFAVFTASPASGAAPLAVAFLLRPPRGAYQSTYIDFGDGQAATPALVSSRPPTFATTHTYAAPGAYTAVAGAQVCSPSGEKCAPVVFSDLIIRVPGRK